MIQWKATSDRLGVTLDDVDQLLNGRATAKVAGRLGLTLADIDDFVRGAVSANIASRFGLSPLSAVDELAKALTREGRIGLLVGLLFAGA